MRTVRATALGVSLSALLALGAVSASASTSQPSHSTVASQEAAQAQRQAGPSYICWAEVSPSDQVIDVICSLR